MTQNEAEWKQNHQTGANIRVDKDLSGKANNATVVGIENIKLNAASPSDGQILTYNGTNWINQTLVIGEMDTHVSSISGSYNVMLGDSSLVTTSSATATLPATSTAGRIVLIGNNITVKNNGGTTLLAGPGLVLCVDGTNWSFIT